MDPKKEKTLETIRAQKKGTIPVENTPVSTQEGTERTVIIQDIEIGTTKIRTTEIGMIGIGMTRIKEREGLPLRGSPFAIRPRSNQFKRGTINRKLVVGLALHPTPDQALKNQEHLPMIRTLALLLIITILVYALRPS